MNRKGDLQQQPNIRFCSRDDEGTEAPIYPTEALVRSRRVRGSSTWWTGSPRVVFQLVSPPSRKHASELFRLRDKELQDQDSSLNSERASERRKPRDELTPILSDIIITTFNLRGTFQTSPCQPYECAAVYLSKYLNRFRWWRLEPRFSPAASDRSIYTSTAAGKIIKTPVVFLHRISSTHENKDETKQTDKNCCVKEIQDVTKISSHHI